MAKKRGLGRGLDALLSGGAQIDALADADSTPAPDVSDHLSVDKIQRGRYQPRRHFDEEKLRELADSISAQGMVQPIVVRPQVGDQYEIIAGERRWRAAQMAGLSEVPVIIKEVDDQSAMAMALIENIQRDDLNPLEEATAMHRLLKEFNLTHQQVADAVGKSRTTVTNLIRLLDLQSDVREMIESKQIEMGHARALLGLKSHVQSQAAEKVVRKNLTVRATEALVRELNQSAQEKPAQAADQQEDPDVRRLLHELTDKLGAKVVLQQGNAGKGKLVINYNNHEELQGILAHIK